VVAERQIGLARRGVPVHGAAVEPLEGGAVLGGASADLYLSDGTEINFESMRDVANATRLTLEIAACTGATPSLKAPQAIRAVALLRALAEHHRAFTADEIAFGWGVDFLQSAPALDVDLNDRGARWGAFSHLATIDPLAHSHERGGSIADASVVLRHTDGARYVRCGWLKDSVRRSDATVTPQELAHRMERVGWQRRGATGHIKASQPVGRKTLAWTFYVVPVGWEDHA